ncbi:ABC transporter permease [Elstera litoralis]|uniref:ABC transporter permease n=1 Tax=Elstera litoralis TaxID=552518 RepID=UPI000A07A84A|nr:iron ABC transporter permease [Elstera litoralis]
MPLRWHWGRVGGGWAVLALGLALVLALPILTILGSFLFPAWDVWAHLLSTVMPTYLRNTLLLMLGVGLGVAVIGVGTAWLVTLCQFPGARAFEILLLLPLAFPAYVVAYAYTGLLDSAGPVQSLLRAGLGLELGSYWFPPIRSLGGAIAVMVLVLYPYVYLLARAAFLEQSVCVLEAGRSLGQTPFGCFRRLAVPLARPAIAGGVALALMETLNDFGTVQYFAVDTLTAGIYRTWLGMNEPAAATQLAGLLLLFVIGLMALERQGRSGSTRHTSLRYRHLPRFQLSPRKAALAMIACLLPCLLGFIVPLLMLLAWAFDTAPAMVNAAFWDAAEHSLLLAVIAAGVAVSLALTLAYARRLHPTWLVRGATRSASLGYAVPGLVIAVGVIIPLAAIDTAVDGASRRLFGVSTGLILSGTLIALLFAYVIRFLAIALNAVESALGKVTPQMDFAARSLGRSAGETLWSVHLPIIRPSLLAAALLVFVDVMKELPATLILRPFNFDTLAVLVFAMAGDERLADAAPASLAIMLVGLLPVLLLARALARSRPGTSSGQE